MSWKISSGAAETSILTPALSFPRRGGIKAQMAKIDDALIAELNKVAEPGALMAELHKRFGQRLAIGTSGQLTGTVLIDLAVKAGVKPRVFTNDTLRLFPETYELFDAIERKYGLKIERFGPPADKLKQM